MTTRCRGLTDKKPTRTAGEIESPRGGLSAVRLQQWRRPTVWRGRRDRHRRRSLPAVFSTTVDASGTSVRLHKVVGGRVEAENENEKRSKNVFRREYRAVRQIELIAVHIITIYEYIFINHTRTERDVVIIVPACKQCRFTNEQKYRKKKITIGKQ